jgi:tRNA(Ile)-lysidine synthase
MELPELLPGSRAVLGFSGGVDSVFLSQWLVERYGIRPYLLHVNYGLRPESDDDEQWCRWYAAEHRFEIEVLRADPNKRSGENVQNWARRIRYHWFNERAKALNAPYIFTAHHADDRRETFIMNALRGSGLTGMTGMNNRKILRPLAHMDKAEIEKRALERGLEWREDASNATLKYTRNKIRNLLPDVFDTIDPRWRGGLKKSIDNLSRDAELLNGLLDHWAAEYTEVKGGEHIIHFGPWIEAPYAQVLLYRFVQTMDYGIAFEEVGHVLFGESGQRTSGKTHMLVRDRKKFYLSPIREIDHSIYTVNSPSDLDQLPFELRLTEKPISEVSYGPDTEWMSPSALTFPLTFRIWKPGDTFLPLGMSGKKKIADFLNDLRVPRHHKEHVYVAVSDSEIVWVLGYRIAQSLKVADSDDTAYLAEINIPL